MSLLSQIRKTANPHYAVIQKSKRNDDVANPNPKTEQLTPFNELPPEELKEISRKGGIARAEKIQERIDLNKMLMAMATGDMPKDDERYEYVHKLIGDKPKGAHRVLYNTLYDNRSVDALNEFDKRVGIIETDNRNFELPAMHIGKDFVDLNREIEPNKTYCLEGGRGSLKSSFVSMKIIELMLKYPQMHCCVVRKQTNTLRDSVYAQMKWAIDILGLTEEFDCTVSPLEITYKATGQKIYFRGCDKPEKLKSIKTPFGYIGILWREERDQLNGIQEERSIKQSVLRGGELSFDFATYNPPISKSHWVNVDSEANTDNNTIYHKSNYQNAPKQWLGAKFIQEAEHLKQVNEKAYLHEYMGVPIGNGTNVFENVEVRAITDEELNSFDYIYMGIDWGYNPDPFRWVKVGYRDETVYILDEYSANKKSNKEVWQILQEEKQVNEYDFITADSAEPKSIDDLRSYGANIRKAEKGQGSVHYGIKWLQTRKQIVISEDCPITAKEFLNYEYEKTKDGEPISAYPDKDNHSIDATRYALERVWRKRGQ